MPKRTIADIDVAGKRVLVRAEFNVPLDAKRRIADASRLEASLPTLRYLLEQGARVILVSHLGRPTGPDPALSFGPVAERLGELLGQPVAKADDCVGPVAEEAVARLQAGQALLLENVRFHAGEKSNDPEFARALASLADLYVNDAFGTLHRAHASVVGVTEHLPAVAGFLLGKEVEALSGLIGSPERPYLLVLGGAKVADKLEVIESLLPQVDRLVIGGGMAYTFLKTQGLEIGKSLLDEEFLDHAADLLRRAPDKILLPTDLVIADHFREPTTWRQVPADQIPPDMEGVDIGDETRQRFAEEISQARTVFWNGPMGVFELEQFAEGTRAVGEAMARVHAAGGRAIIGGGDSGAAARQMGFADRVTHICTGGGASLEFLEGKELPGLAVLPER